MSTSIDIDFLPGNVACLFTTKKAHRSSDIGGRSQTRNRKAFRKSFLFVFRFDTAANIGQDEPRGNAVDRYAVWRNFARARAFEKPRIAAFAAA